MKSNLAIASLYKALTINRLPKYHLGYGMILKRKMFLVRYILTSL